MNLVEQSLQIPAGGVALDADMAVPESATGVVLFAHNLNPAIMRRWFLGALSPGDLALGLFA